MPSLRPPKDYRRGFSDETCRRMAERALRSPEGREALVQGWGRLLWDYVIDWGSTPTRPETRKALWRAHDDFLWHLMDMRKIQDPDDMTKRWLAIGEAMMAREEELKRKYLGR